MVIPIGPYCAKLNAAYSLFGIPDGVIAANVLSTGSRRIHCRQCVILIATVTMGDIDDPDVDGPKVDGTVKGE